jgi:SSS family solute:Na+ symporter
MGDLMGNFGTLNWTILIVYVCGNLLLGYYLSKGISTADHFYLGNRTTPWWAIGISVIATYVSALSFLGGPSWAYADGFSVIALHANYPIVIFVVITLFLPFFYNSGVASIYDYQERRFGPRARALISSIWLVSQTMTSAAILYATSLVLEFITGIDVVHAIVIVTVIALIYTALGGITAVIWTDVAQAGILLVGALIILFALVQQMPESIGDTLTSLKAQGKLNPLEFNLDFTQATTAWSGIIAMTFYHITVYGTNQMMVQRTLASKTIGDAKKSYLMMGFAAFFIYFLFIFLGVMFYSYYQGAEFENSNTIILQFAADYGLPGLMGLIAAAVMAASMSSLDSAFNSMSTVMTVDFYQKYLRKGASPEHYLKASRLFTVLIALIIIVPAIVLTGSKGSILLVLSNIGSWFVGAQLGMFAVGFFSKQATEKGVLVGTAIGFVMVWYIANFTDIAWPWYCAIGAISNIVITILASVLLDGIKTEYSPYTIRGQIKKFRDEGRDEKQDGWYLVPGKVDRVSYLLLVFFAVTMLFLFLFGRAF